MRILYPFPEPLPLPKARGLQVAWMVDALCAAGVQVTLTYVPSAEDHPLQPIGKEIPPNLQLLPLSYHWPFPFRRWHSVARFAALLDQEIDRVCPDVIFVRHFKLAERLLRLRPSLPLVYEAHEVFAATVPAGKQTHTRHAEAFVLQRAAGVVYISEAVQAAVRAAYTVAGEEIVLHSGVSIPDGIPEKEWQHCGRHIIYAGSFYGWKGVDDLVAAAAMLPGCRCTLMGGEADEVERLAARVVPGGAEVILLPRLPAHEVITRLSSACIAVLPNRAEGVSHFTSPLKLFEYMGAGCAVVAADLPSIREVVSSEEASWFTPGDPASLATTLRRLVAEPERARAYGQTAKRKAHAYTWSARAERLERFMSALARKSAAP